MSDNPVFVYAAVYADRADAEADYDTLLDDDRRGSAWPSKVIVGLFTVLTPRDGPNRPS